MRWRTPLQPRVAERGCLLLAQRPEGGVPKTPPPCVASRFGQRSSLAKRLACGRFSRGNFGCFSSRHFFSRYCCSKGDDSWGSSLQDDVPWWNKRNSGTQSTYLRRTPAQYLRLESSSDEKKKNDLIPTDTFQSDFHTSTSSLLTQKESDPSSSNIDRPDSVPSLSRPNESNDTVFAAKDNVTDSILRTDMPSAIETHSHQNSCPAAVVNGDHSNQSAQKRWFPHSNIFEIDSRYDSLTSDEVIEMMKPLLVDGRINRMEQVIDSRTYSVVPIVEGISDLGNISAICRTSEALGFQSVQVISPQSSRRFKDNRKISMGTDKWLDVHLWDDTTVCLNHFKSFGYRVVSTYISPDTVSIYDIDWTVPSVIVFGNEKKGISQEALALSDIQCSIPMSGMVDSFNISVSVGIILHHVLRERINKLGYHGDLSDEEKKILLANFILRHKESTASIIKNLITQKGVVLGQRSGKHMKKILRRIDEDLA